MHTPVTSPDSLAFYSLLINAMPGKHLVLLPDAPRFTIAAVTDAFLAVFGLHREALVGFGVFDVFFHDEQNKGVSEHFLHSMYKVLLTRKSHQMADQRHRWPNVGTGELEWRTWRPVNKPILASDNELIGVIHTIEDITHSVQLVELTHANQYLQAIINGFKEPLQVLEPIIENGQIIDFRFNLTNQAYATYANTTPEQLQGKRVSEVFPGYFETESFTNPVITFTTGKPLTFEIHYNKDGLDLYNFMSTAKLNNEVVIHFTDFTRLRLLQLQLESKIDELKRSNDSLQQFAYTASHDLQEPLRKVQQFGDLLKDQHKDQLGDGIDYLDRMQQATRRMSTLIQDLLTFSRVSNQRDTTEMVSLNEIVNAVLTDLELVIKEAGVVITTAPLPTIQGDALQLGQLFQNLLSNAIKFRREGSTTEIRVRYQKMPATDLPTAVKPTLLATYYHHIEVSDNGIGFEQQYAERIFQLFHRLHGRNKYPGTGIGLAICEKVVTNHGGAITATSQPGQGATFTVYLPVTSL